jgi:hypothetical protein
MIESSCVDLTTGPALATPVIGTKASILERLSGTADTQGIVIAMPHGGPILEAARDLVDGTQSLRPVTFTIDRVVAGHRSTNSETDFDDLIGRFAIRSVVDVIVLDRAGTLLAARHLRAGGVVVVLADIVNDFRRSVSVPWLGGVRSVMRGAAWLSLVNNAALIAAAPIRLHDDHVESHWQAIGDPDTRYARKSASYLMTLELWKAFERLHELGASQLRETYEVFRPAPLRALFEAIHTEAQLLRAFEALIGPSPDLLDQAPNFALLLEDLRARAAIVGSHDG